MEKNRMTIDEIRRTSLEYAKGNVRTGPLFRTPRVNRSKQRRRSQQRTYAEWFADSLKHGRRTGKPPDVQVDTYRTQNAGDDGKAPW
jgi:hypothetical protein